MCHLTDYAKYHEFVCFVIHIQCKESIYEDHLINHLTRDVGLTSTSGLLALDESTDIYIDIINARNNIYKDCLLLLQIHRIGRRRGNKINTEIDN